MQNIKVSLVYGRPHDSVQTQTYALFSRIFLISLISSSFLLRSFPVLFFPGSLDSKQKLLTMLPTEEERSRIQEAQAANPDLPLGSAEQFLLTLASISELPARLKLWAFKLDFENSEKVSSSFRLFISIVARLINSEVATNFFSHEEIILTFTSLHLYEQGEYLEYCY